MASLVTCKVHPVVLLSIVDAYERRDAKEGSNKKVIGALLGNFEKGVVEITNAFAVPHCEINDNAQLSFTHFKEFYECNKAVNPLEVCVGSFSTWPSIDGTSLNFHEFFQQNAAKQCTDAVHLIVDADVASKGEDSRGEFTLDKTRMGLKAYVMKKVAFPETEKEKMSRKIVNGSDLEKKDRSLCAIFVPIDVEIVAYEPEKVALSLITPLQEKQKTAVQMTTGLKQLSQSVDQMLNWIEKLKQYIDDVTSKKKPGDVTVGRKLNDLVNSAAHLRPGQFDAMLNTGMKDFLMVAYLAELAKTELKLYEKLASV